MRSAHGIRFLNGLPGLTCVVTVGILCALDRGVKNRIMLMIIASDSLPDALTGILTFTTLVLGFVGVLLPTIIGMKKESELVERFFQRVPQDIFSRVIRNNILTGLALTLVTICMFFSVDIEVISLKAVLALGWGTVTLLVYYIVSTFRVLNLLLRLLVEETIEIYPNG